MSEERPWAAATADLATRAAEARAAEAAFARSMAERDLAAFARHVAEDAVFLGADGPLRGRAAIVALWARWFEGPAAPFSWHPEVVEVNALGDLAYSEGPVSAPDGQPIARFASTWRRTAGGEWQVVFDRGWPVPAR